MKLKFKIGEITVKNLDIDFQGNEEERRVVERMVGAITDLPHAIVDIEAKDVSPQRQLPFASVVPPPPTHRRRRTNRKPSSGDGASVSLNGGAVTEEDAPAKPTRARRSRGLSYKAQVKNLIKEDFFQHKRTNEDVRNELIRRGFTFELRRITHTLVTLCQSNQLSRTPNSEVAGGWEYENFTGASV